MTIRLASVKVEVNLPIIYSHDIQDYGLIPCSGLSRPFIDYTCRTSPVMKTIT